LLIENLSAPDSYQGMASQVAEKFDPPMEDDHWG